MLTNKTQETYIATHTSPESELLQQLYRQTHVQLLNPRMTSGHVQGRLLKMLVQMTGAQTVLELGTFSGYSTLCFAEGLPEHGRIITIEKNDELEDFARSFFQRSEHGHKITQYTGQALDIIPALETNFDMVFLDADKREYPAYYHAVFDKVPSGGYIIADNTLWDGKLYSSIAENDSQSLALAEFNRMVVADPRVEVVILPLRDGLSIIRKK